VERLVATRPPSEIQGNEKRRTRETPVRLRSLAAGGQRLAMYIVISKPKRKSVKAGVVHCMFLLQLKVGTNNDC
jgi:hypothetical protein